MHILIAFLGSLITVFYLLDRLGVDIGGFNTQEQANSMIELMVEVVSADGEVTSAQSEFIESMRTHFDPPPQNQGTWS
jgi:hypothetical protein